MNLPEFFVVFDQHFERPDLPKVGAVGRNAVAAPPCRDFDRLCHLKG